MSETPADLEAEAQRHQQQDRRGADLQAWLNRYTLDKAQTAYADERRPPGVEADRPEGDQ
jgi:hypothetical protein